MNYKTPNPKNKRIIWVLGIGILVAVIAAVALLMMLRSEPIQGEPTLTVETPQKISRSSTQTITLEVLISDLGDAIYPAASMTGCPSGWGGRPGPLALPFMPTCWSGTSGRKKATMWTR